jgi:4-diphosphocytidyl-2-C-methyl-D-erythritol kinase
MTRFESHAAAKVNLTLAVLARRADGYHELSSLVTFAAIGDTLTLEPGTGLDLAVRGQTSDLPGPVAENLVLKAAQAACGRIENLKIGHFELTKRLPAGAGLGGGSADAAAALRLIAQANDIDPSDTRLFDAALAVGADVPVCLDPRARLMHGVGEVLSSPLSLPRLDAVIVFPGMSVATADVFGSFTLAAGARRKMRYTETDIPHERSALIQFLASEANDLELAARLVAPVIGEVRAMLEATRAPELVRMTGSGSAVFAIYRDARDAKKATESIAKKKPKWWVVATTLNA